jgi:sulfite reductase beta subunit-like hemoprotein
MKARMKFLIQSMGWDTFVAKLDEERERVGPVPLADYISKHVRTKDLRRHETD